MKKNMKKIVSQIILLTMVIMLFQTNGVIAAENSIDNKGISDKDAVTNLPNYNKQYGLEKFEEKHKSSNYKNINKPVNMKYIAVFIEFSDVQNITLSDSKTLEKAEAVFNTGGINESSYGKIPIISLKEYLKKTSYGKINIDTKIYPKNGSHIVPYVPNKPRTYFMKKSSYAPDGYSNITEQLSREKELINGALLAIKSQVESDFTADELDHDGDGQIDAISFFAEGVYGSDGVEFQDLLWPHKANGYFNTVIHGKSVNAYNLISAGNPKRVGGVFSHSRTSYSVIIHEFLHTLGLPDLYRLRGGTNPVGQWDIMAASNRQSPQSITSYYLREYLSWANPLDTLGSGKHRVTLSMPEYIDKNEKVAVKVQSPFNVKEYFVIEYRKKDGLDKHVSMDHGGIIVYRINTEIGDAIGNAYDNFMYIYRPNEPYLGAGKGNLEKATLSKESMRTSLGKGLGDEVAGFDNGTIHYSNGTNSGIIISNVSSSSSNTITFDIYVPSIDGSGTKEDPFIIDEASDLELVRNRDDAYFKMVSDIDMSGITEFKNLGRFKGKFDGQGHKISNLNININSIGEAASLFEIIDFNAEVKNLVLENINVKNESSRAAILAGSIHSIVDNVKIVSGRVEGSGLGSAGGLTGYASESAKITNTYSMASVTGGGNIGGLIGISANGIIENCYVAGKVTKKNPTDNIGGFIGENTFSGGETYNKPKNSYFDMNKTTQTEAIGNVRIPSWGEPIIGGTGKEGPIGVKVDDEITLDSLTNSTKQIILKTNPKNEVLNGTWESLDQSIVTVSSGGLVTLVSSGDTEVSYNIPVGSNIMKLVTKVSSLKLEINPKIKGVTDVSLKAGTYFDPMDGVTAEDKDGRDITSSIKLLGNVDVNIPGKYILTYTVTDSFGKTTSIKRNITVNPALTVVNAIPTISAINRTIAFDSNFDPMDGVTAEDKEDGDITNNIKIVENTVDTNKVGTYKVVYEVKDSKGATATKMIEVKVIENRFDVESMFKESYWNGDKLVFGGTLDLLNTDLDQNIEKTLLIKDSDGNIVNRINTWNAPWNNNTGYQCFIYKDDLKKLKNGDYKLFIKASLLGTDYEVPVKQPNLSLKYIVHNNINKLEHQRFGEDAIKFFSDSNNEIKFTKEVSKLTPKVNIKTIYFNESGMVIDGNQSFENYNLEEFASNKLVIKDANDNAVEFINTWKAGWGEKNTGFQGIISKDILSKLINGEYTLYIQTNFDGIDYETKLVTDSSFKLNNTINNFEISVNASTESITFKKDTSLIYDSSSSIREAYWEGKDFVINGLVDIGNNDLTKSDVKKLVIKDTDGNKVGEVSTIAIDWFSNKGNFNGFQAIIPSSLMKKLDIGIYSLEVQTNYKSIEYINKLNQSKLFKRAITIHKNINDTKSNTINDKLYKFATDSDDNVVLNVNQI